MTIIDTSAVGQVVKQMVSGITDNIGPIIGVIAFIFAVSFVMAWIDTAVQDRQQKEYADSWAKLARKKRW